MDSTEIRDFLEGHDVYALNPDTRETAACITYGRDGRCVAQFTDGQTDTGVWGIGEASYWTRYETFRDGKPHLFRLEARGPGVAQAYFADGTMALLQSHDAVPALD